MKFLDLLRKLGILRFGAVGGVYHNANERPLSLQMDEAFDPQKDVFALGKNAVSKKRSDGEAPKGR